MTHPSYLAIDLGASSGRAVVGTLRDGVMSMREVHRFRTPLVEEPGHLYWDVDALWSDVQLGVARAREVAPTLRSISVDSWAVDYVPLDGAGELVRRPYAYRDPRTHGRTAAAIARAGGTDALYARTGIQTLPFNTLPQVVCDLDDEPDLVARTRVRLMIAEYFLYRLSGERVAERTMASTTQVLDATTGEWAIDVIRRIGDDPSRWPRIVAPGAILGALGATGPRIVAACAHDTASAVAAVPASGDRAWAYVSSGTWSLVGAELAAPVLTDAARAANFTNEAGLAGTVRFLKNRTGMWALEECMREWESIDGMRPSYDALMNAAAEASPSSGTIDLNAPTLGERGDMPAKLVAACHEIGQTAPTERGAMVRLILDSLAVSCADTLDELDALTGRRTEDVHVVGGGARNTLLNQLTADACGRRVIAGPDEATVLGNLLVQARALGDLHDGDGVRTCARRSVHLTEFVPRVSPALR